MALVVLQANSDHVSVALFVVSTNLCLFAGCCLGDNDKHNHHKNYYDHGKYDFDDHSGAHIFSYVF